MFHLILRLLPTPLHRLLCGIAHRFRQKLFALGTLPEEVSARLALLEQLEQ